MPRLCSFTFVVIALASLACADDPPEDTRPELLMAPEVEISTAFVKPLGQVTAIGVGDQRWGTITWSAATIEAGDELYPIPEQQIADSEHTAASELDAMALVAYTSIKHHRALHQARHYNPGDALDGTCTWAPDTWTYCKRWATRTVQAGCFSTRTEVYCAEWGAPCNIFNGAGCPHRGCDCCNQHDNAYFAGGTCADKAAADQKLGECVARCLGGRTGIGGLYGWATDWFGSGNFHDAAGNGC